MSLIVYNGSPASHGDVRSVPEPTASNRSLGPAPVCYRCTAAPPKSPLEISISVFNTNGSRTSYKSRLIRQCAWGIRLTDSSELAGETITEFLCADMRRTFHTSLLTRHRGTQPLLPGYRGVQNDRPQANKGLVRSSDTAAKPGVDDRLPCVSRYTVIGRDIFKDERNSLG